MSEYLVTIKTTRHLKIQADSLTEAVRARDRIYDANVGLVNRMRAGGSPIDELRVEVAAHPAGCPLTPAGEIATKASIDRIMLAICECHDGQDLWAHTRRDPDTFRRAIEFALKPPVKVTL